MKYLILLILILLSFSCVKKNRKYTKSIFVVSSIENTINGWKKHPGMVYYKIDMINDDNDLNNKWFWTYDAAGLHNINDTISFTTSLKSTQNNLK